MTEDFLNLSSKIVCCVHCLKTNRMMIPLQQGSKQGTASLNLADFASPVETQGQQVSIPLLIPGAGVAVESNASLHVRKTCLD